eukprot:CAMPEP_0181306572 /NCGR_PEP_ID=MMETSP1101-20121128/10378_1 /TAXON_ID=46948 /ORGANISM="Rhodomonas abbreviata, Strain Caron Lab Isolate" /LENGTH=482 /DNA_ID=CAMNT_0023412651 /DNA_START=74 /DNA_END=1522 /DNA_ORIENTATION=-
MMTMCYQQATYRPKTSILSDAISLSEAMSMENTPCAVLSVAEPHEIDHVSERFCELFQLSEGELLSRTMRMVHGPRTNIALFAQKCKDAGKGSKQDGLFHCYTKDCQEIFCNLKVVPVVDESGHISHLLATLDPVRDVEVGQDVPPVEEEFLSSDVFGFSFAPPRKDAYEDDAFDAKDIMFGASDTARRSVEAFSAPTFNPTASSASYSSAPLTKRAADLSSFCSGFTDAPIAHQLQEDTVDAQASIDAQASASSESVDDAQTLRLFRRKKHGGESCANGAGPVDISLKLLKDMSHLSLKEASQKLGLSTSAMKKACRKLGVERWPIPSAKTPVIKYNSAYVRRLYCKYAEKGKDEEEKGMQDDESPVGSFLPGYTIVNDFAQPPPSNSDLSDCFGHAVEPSMHPTVGNIPDTSMHFLRTMSSGSSSGSNGSGHAVHDLSWNTESDKFFSFAAQQRTNAFGEACWEDGFAPQFAPLNVDHLL